MSMVNNTSISCDERDPWVYPALLSAWSPATFDGSSSLTCGHPDLKHSFAKVTLRSSYKVRLIWVRLAGVIETSNVLSASSIR